MNQGLRTSVLAGLLLAASVSHAAIPDGTVDPAHIKYAGRASAAVPALRSSAAFVLDTTHSSVLYSRRSDVAVPIASITKLMTAPFWRPRSRSMSSSRSPPRIAVTAGARLPASPRGPR